MSWIAPSDLSQSREEIVVVGVHEILSATDEFALQQPMTIETQLSLRWLEVASPNVCAWVSSHQLLDLFPEEGPEAVPRLVRLENYTVRTITRETVGAPHFVECSAELVLPVPWSQIPLVTDLETDSAAYHADLQRLPQAPGTVRLPRPVRRRVEL